MSGSLIRFIRPPEPLSGAAKKFLRGKDNPPDQCFIRTDRARRIGYELARYCLRQQEGCSLLIAGGRGAGKTTLTRLVVQDLIVDWRRHRILVPDIEPRSTGSAPLIPMMILLHGPTLLDVYERDDWFVKAPDGLTDPELIGKRAESRRHAALKERALRGIITALYTHLRDAVTDAWDNATLRRHGNVLVPELAELRAQLELTLNGAPDPATLRRLWKRAGFLGAGVLQAQYPSLYGYEPPEDQAVRELHALAACAQSFSSILGQIKETQTRGQKSLEARASNVTQTETRIVDDKPKPAADGATGRAVASTAPALAAAATVLTQTHQTLPEVALVGVGALVLAQLSLWLSRLTLSASIRRERTTQSDRTVTIDVDWSSQRLERELPQLLALVKQAGLAPIFVIDELDKLEDPFKELHDLLHVTKHIVRDQAAFLFLANRDYFERLMTTREDLDGSSDSADQGGAKRGKDAASTYYEHFMALFYAPVDFRRYFETLARDAAGHNGDVLRDPAPLNPLDTLALGTILTFRSRLSPFGFNRRLNALLDDHAQLRDGFMGKGEPFADQMLRQHLLLQLASEEVAEKANIAQRIESQPRDAQMIYDTLYYIADLIEVSGPAPSPIVQLHITKSGLRTYLINKASSERGPSQTEFLTADTLDWLFGLIKQQVAILADPRSLI